MREDLLIPPAYCHYAAGPCDQNLGAAPDSELLFLFPSTPGVIASTIESAAQAGGEKWKTWRSLPVAGQIILCEICKGIRHASTVVADVTTLNFNLMFEIGAALGLGVPLIPIRDTSYVKDSALFELLGLLDGLGYVDFTNAEELAEGLRDRLPVAPLPANGHDLHLEAPLFIVRGKHQTEGEVQLLAAIKKSALNYRQFDPSETIRLTLGDARRQVGSSIAVIAHLLSPHREGGLVHNARCAFVSGLAFAQGKAVLMIQEEEVAQPIDYRDLVRSYTNPSQVPDLVEPVFRRTIELIQVAYGTKSRTARGSLLEALDLGDGAAENEVPGLARYFVPTGQFRHISRGHARLVVGRKGSGKTAIFFEVRAPLLHSRSRLVVDLRPDGPQFGKLRAFLAALDPALQEHTMMAFWTYLLLSEIAKRIVDEYQYARLDPRRLELWERVDEVYSALAPGVDVDFSQRLLVEVDRVIDAWGESSHEGLAPDVTERVFAGDIRQLRSVTSDYMAEKDEVWVLVDNLDKSWPIRGSTEQDIAMLRGLLEATRKIQQDFEDLGVMLNCLVFLRTDIYDHLLGLTPDKGKDTVVRLDWEDPAVFKR